MIPGTSRQYDRFLQLGLLLHGRARAMEVCYMYLVHPRTPSQPCCKWKRRRLLDHVRKE
jgi:hypothetical protein